MKYITSSFSLQMLPGGGRVKISKGADIILFYMTSPAPKIAIGHEGTARWLEKKLNNYLSSDTNTSYRAGVGEYRTTHVGHEYMRVEVDRTPVTLQVGDSVLVLQPVGKRLQPGEELSDPEISAILVNVEDAEKLLVSRSWYERAREALDGMD